MDPTDRSPHGTDAALGSLICGVLAAPGQLFSPLAFVLGVTAVITGHIAVRNGSADRRLAIVGLVLGYVACVVAVLVTVWFFVCFVPGWNEFWRTLDLE